MSTKLENKFSNMESMCGDAYEGCKNMDMTVEEHAKQQAKILEGFYKEFFTWDMTHLGCWIMIGIMVFVQGVYCVIPAQEWLNDFKTSLFIIGMPMVWYITSYIQAYAMCRDGNKMVRVYDKLKYLPISLGAFRYFLLNKLVRFVSKVFVVDFILQIVFSLIINRRLTLLNLLVPVFVGLLLPLLLGIILVWAMGGKK